MSGENAVGASIPAAVRDAGLLTIGLASLAGQAVEAALRTDGGPAGSAPQLPVQRAARQPASLFDTAFGGALVTVRGTARVASSAVRAVRIVARPVTTRLLPDGWLSIPRVRAITDLGHDERLLAEREAGVLTRRLISRLVVLVLDQLDLTHEVLERVDLNAVVKSVDLDAAVGLVNLDMIVDRIDLNRVVRRVDLDAIIDTVDLNRAVRRVDLDELVDGVDLDRAIRRVDIDAVIASADINAVLDRLDLVGMAADIVAALDLPDIIRDSSGSLATSMVRDTRLQSMAADEAVSRIVDRLLLRRHRSRIPPPGDPAE